ncbi:4-hydroxy-3-methylbut-2-enyl diphosphate reductase [[Clostridium] aminophilum]|uniref:4-hydroxy-3-methylbut-2-enyl diphosphate reductase n=1 Tax=[Clostridium] aminophilum TaxID=1526 RepID=A0A1I6IIQ8_9FIRM|nr:4-hydroxy-3-methylbut-2-enyl diphosphate reductase [[Clostridium] aminophilum]SFR66539.1 4-hydroxy-3-methylbut-2-enyl diphosphate reductase [[Clostridium] aminophilum]
MADNSIRVIVAESAGFCFGVKRAMDIVEKQISEGIKPIYTYGPIIHNEEVVSDLESRGVKVLENEEDLLAVREGTVILRSHGVARRVYDLLNERGIRYVDVTCPFVSKIHQIVQEQNRNGRRVIIVGSADHPEVQGIVGWADEHTRVINSPEEFLDLKLSKEEKLSVVAQTTYNYKKFQYLVEKIAELGYDTLCLNTICNATQERQAEAKSLASSVDAMIVIGGKSSSNTRKLYDICRQECSNTYYIQTLKDLKPDRTITVRNVGITAGASTPNKIIEEVHTNVRNEF